MRFRQISGGTKEKTGLNHLSEISPCENAAAHEFEFDSPVLYMHDRYWLPEGILRVIIPLLRIHLLLLLLLLVHLLLSKRRRVM